MRASQVQVEWYQIVVRGNIVPIRDITLVRTVEIFHNENCITEHTQSAVKLSFPKSEQGTHTQTCMHTMNKRMAKGLTYCFQYPRRWAPQHKGWRTGMDMLLA